jgi:hypothetical protein
MRIASDDERVRYTRNPHSGHSWEDDEAMPIPYHEEEAEEETQDTKEKSKTKDSTHGG